MKFLEPIEVDPRLKIRALWGFALTFAALAVPQASTLIHFQPLGIDFLPLWTAGRMAWSEPGQVYDFAAVTHAQAWLLPHATWMRPYAYPPTTLLILAPLGLMPFWLALALWLVIGVGMFLYAGIRLSPERPRLSLALMLLSPAVLLAVLVGQTILIVAGLSVMATTEIANRPRFAGVLLGVAAALKPQVMLLAPVALVAMGALDATIAAAGTGLALVALSGAVFGPQSWLDWLSSLARFQEVVEQTPHLIWGVITPSAAVHELGLPNLAVAAVRAGCALFAVAIAWRAWRQPQSAARRVAALLGGCLLITPYAMHYDGSVLVPTAVGAAATRLSAPGWSLRCLALAASAEITTPFVGCACLIVFLALTFFELKPRQAAEDALAIGRA